MLAKETRFAFVVFLLGARFLYFVYEALLMARGYPTWWSPRQLIAFAAVMGTLGFCFSVATFVSVGSDRSGLNDNCAVDFDADIGGPGVRGAFWAQELVSLVTALLGLTHYRRTAGKEIGAGLMITQTSLAFALFHQLRIRSLAPPDAAVGSMVLDGLNSALSIQMSLKETLASRWQVSGVLISQLLGLVAIGSAMGQFTKGLLDVKDTCKCFSFFWWAWLSNCSKFDPMETMTFWVYYTLRCVHLIHNAWFSWRYTRKFDKDEKQQIQLDSGEMERWESEHEQQLCELMQLDGLLSNMKSQEIAAADRESIENLLAHLKPGVDQQLADIGAIRRRKRFLGGGGYHAKDVSLLQDLQRHGVEQIGELLRTLEKVQDRMGQELQRIGPGAEGADAWGMHSVWHVQQALQNHLGQQVRLVQRLLPLPALGILGLPDKLKTIIENLKALETELGLQDQGGSEALGGADGQPETLISPEEPQMVREHEEDEVAHAALRPQGTDTSQEALSKYRMALVRLLMATVRFQLEHRISPMLLEVEKAQNIDIAQLKGDAEDPDGSLRRGESSQAQAPNGLAPEMPPIWNARLATISLNFIPSGVISITSMAAAEMTVKEVDEDGLTIGQSAAVVIAFATACRALWVFGFRFINDLKKKK